MNHSRRAFLKASVVATGSLAVSTPRLESASLRDRVRRDPPRRAMIVPGVHVYLDRESYVPGETVRVHISADVPIQATVERLGLAVDDPAHDTQLTNFGVVTPGVQPIHPGSYVHVERGIKSPPRQFSIEAWVRPWRVDRLMGVVTQKDTASSTGWALVIGEGGTIGFHIGDGQAGGDGGVHGTEGDVVQKRQWHHVVARWDGETKEVWIDGMRRGQWRFAGTLILGSHPIRLGALGKNGVADHFLDGDIAMVTLHGVALEDDVIKARFAERGSQPAKGVDVLACWTFSEERGDRVADLSRFRRHGRIINHGTWMIGGPAFDASVPRFGDYDPRKDSRRGHGLRLASDDLYDCGWTASLRWRVPSDAKSGMYVVRLRWEKDNEAFFQHATFIVRRARRKAPAPILLLAASNTWRAYNAAAFGKPRPGLRQLCGTDGLPNSPGDPPAFSYYRGHAAGMGTYQVGTRVPWPAANPYLRYGDATDYSHLARADRFAQTWLEREGYDYDMIADIDLHRDPGQLHRHRVLIINGHSEYWSIEMYRGLEEYLAAGGRVIVLSGNSLFWRVSFNEDGTIMECRKVDAPGDQLQPEFRGEAWHSHDALRGGMLRECGFPGWALIGLETLGWNNQGSLKNFGPWIAKATDHPVFHTPEETGLKPGDRFGWAGEGRMPMANGHEFDVRLSTLAALATEPLPPGAVMPSDPPGIQRLANGVIPWQHGGAAFDYFFRAIKPTAEQGGEMIWWERPQGGIVFNAGTIGAGWALHADSRWATLLRNVLHHFGVPRERA